MPSPSPEYHRALSAVGGTTLSGLAGLETAFRLLYPPELEALRSALSPAHAELGEALRDFEGFDAPEGLEGFHQATDLGSRETLRALDRLVEPVSFELAIPNLLEAMSAFAAAQRALYPIRRPAPPLNRWFAEPWRHGGLEALEAPPEPTHSIGIHRAPSGPDGRGGFLFYVPEWLPAGDVRPLVIALHGGSGSGEDFLWSWLREARSRGFFLLAPTSSGPTWSLQSPEVDGALLREILAWCSERWAIDPKRVLLTGLSDGATFTLLTGLGADTPYSHLAPIAGVLHPMLAETPCPGRKVYLVHGARDWLFPIPTARVARRELEAMGADLVYRELEDLSHTYPREENARILDWFDPSLRPE